MLDTATILFALAALGFTWGYQPTDDATLEYVIQLTPQEAQLLANSPSEGFTSHVPEEAQPVGVIRIAVGEGPLPREGIPNRLTGADSASDSETGDAGPAASELHGPITETQSRVAKPASGGDTGAGVPTGGAASETTAADDLDRDLAGRLVAVPALPGETRVARLPEGLQLTAQNGSPVQAENDASPAGEARAALEDSADAAAEVAADPPQPQLPEGITQPVYTTGRPTQASVGLPTFGSREPDSGGEAEPREVSPSDRSGDKNAAPPESSQPVEADAERPWLPLVGAIAVACGFLAGNVFQWRSYMSLRKRYLRLLRKTGG